MIRVCDIAKELVVFFALPTEDDDVELFGPGFKTFRVRWPSAKVPRAFTVLSQHFLSVIHGVLVRLFPCSMR